MSPPIELDDKAAVVTGAGRGLGRAYAVALAAAGAGVVVNDLDGDAAAETVGLITSAGGRIIVVGSPAGQHGNFGQTNYAAAKAGIVAVARTWAMELARANVTVNAIVPTAWTQMTATIPIYAPLVEAVESGEPLPREVRQAHAIGMPEDSASLVVFLASGAAAEITGQAIGIGGDKLSLYSHPTEVAAAFHESGWTPELIAENWSTTMAPMTQPYGIQLPPLNLEAKAEATS